MVGQQKPLVTEVALAEALDRSVHKQYTRLRSCPKNRVHLNSL